MTAKSRHCDECVNRRRYSEGKTESPPCDLGHRARFYRPTSDPHKIDWGWKRRCEDFKPLNKNLQS